MKHLVRKLARLSTLAGFLAVSVAVAALMAVDAAAPEFKSVPGYVLTAGPTLDEMAALRLSLHASITEEIPLGTLAHPILVALTESERLDLAARELATARSGPAVVGRTKSVNVHVRFSDLDSRLISKVPGRASAGFAQLTPDGGVVWAVAIRSEGAAGMRLHVRDLDLPEAADMYWMNTSGEVFGPYQQRGPDGAGSFWTHTVSGSEAVLVVRHYGPDGPADMRNVRFVIADLGHVSPAFAGTLGPSTEAFCSYNASCVLNASCNSTDPPADPAKNAVARMQWIQGPYIYTCTGGLLADSARSGARHFLTANHCLSSNSVASNLETYFQYSVPCGTSCPGQLDPGGTRVRGASVESTGSSGDYTLLLLSGTDPLPSGTVFLGWNSTPIAFTNGADLYRISHPAFAPQAYSRHRVDTGAPTCRTWPRGQRIYSRDQEGATEGGSSGSPVLNSNSEVVGQLSGSCGYNTGDACDSVNNATVDGAFAHYYPNISGILGGGACTPTQNPETSCSDGIDNDCDGLIDAADPDCTPSCSPAGATCTSNSQCCSNKCRGGRVKTCR